MRVCPIMFLIVASRFGFCTTNMFWTIVGALLFVFVGIPLIFALVAGGVAALTQKITWRILSCVVGIILVSQLYFDGEKGDDWGIIGLALFGFFLIFLGIIGSFSLEKWREFWKGAEKSSE